MEVEHSGVCARCGHDLDESSSEGLCPACVLDQALDPGSGPGDDRPVRGDGPSRIGDYELFEEVGRGATGVVFRAQQISLDRVVAVKLLRDGPWADPEAIERFRREVRTSAALRHPRIVRIYEVAEDNGQLYYSMDFIDGPNLNVLVEEEPVAPRRAAELVRDLAEAVGHMHDRGVIHRDLKPSNVLLDESGPLITDFGLSTSLDPGAPLTVTGAVLGTPGYLPPEQIGAKFAHQDPTSDPRADIYSLGAMLYALLTGRPPFRGATPFETLMEHLRSEVTPPRQLRRSLPRDLETICLKCLERDPERRYESAADLAEDLERFLTHRPVRARSIGPVGRAWRWTIRHPVLCGLAVLLVLLAVAAGWMRDRLQQGRSEIRLAQTLASMERGDIDQAQGLLAEEVEERGPSPASRRLVVELLSRPGFDLRQTIEMQGTACSFNAKGDLLAVAGFQGLGAKLEVYDLETGALVDARTSHSRPRNLTFSVSMDLGSDQPRTVWNEQLGRLVATDPIEGQSPAFSWLTSESNMVTVDRDLKMTRWDLEAERLEALPETGFPLALDGKRLVYRQRDRLFERDLASGRTTSLLPAGAVLEVSRDGGTALQISSGRRLLAWNLRDRSVIAQIPDGAESHDDVRLSPNGGRLAVGGGEAQRGIRVWDLESVETGPRHLEWIGSRELFLNWARFSADGRFLAVTGLQDGVVSVWIWNVQTGKEVGHLEDQFFPIWSPTDDRLCTRQVPESVAADGGRRLSLSNFASSAFNVWDVTILTPAYRVEHATRDFHLVLQGRRLVAGSTVWDFGPPEEPANLRQDRHLEMTAKELAYLDRQGRPWAVALPEAVGYGTFPVSLVGLEGGRARVTLETLNLPTRRADVKTTLWPFGQQVLFSTRQDTVWVAGPIIEYDAELEASSPWGFAMAEWNLADGTLTGSETLERRDVEANAWAASPDGRTIAIAGRVDDRYGVGLWDVPSETWTSELEHSLFPSAVGFTPGGESLVTVGPESQIEVSHLATETLRSWTGDGEPLRVLAIDARGQILATAGESPEITLWDLAAATPILRWRAHPERVRGLAFHPKERWLVSLGDDGLLKVWDLDVLRRESSRFGLDWQTSFEWSTSDKEGE